MNRINVEPEELDKLRKSGITERQIARFRRLRRNYGRDELDQLPLDRCRLQFVRWLMATGRLTDQIVHKEADVPESQCER